MRLKVLGSGSSGNCYLLENDTECLVLEAGIDYKDVLRFLNFSISKVAGCLVTHEHKDHSKYVKEFIRNGIDVYMSKGTADAVKINSHYINYIKHNDCIKIGDFNIIPFNTKHDAEEPLGFYINHKETGNIVFATDTYYIPNRFRNINNILIECNYDKDILRENVLKEIIPQKLENRIIQSHMEIETCIECLKKNDTRQVCNVVLIHLSGDNSNEEDFISRVRKVMPFADIYTAKAGLDIEFNKCKF